MIGFGKIFVMIILVVAMTTQGEYQEGEVGKQERSFVVPTVPFGSLFQLLCFVRNEQFVCIFFLLL